jgi:hypothetical protein
MNRFKTIFENFKNWDPDSGSLSSQSEFEEPFDSVLQIRYTWSGSSELADELLKIGFEEKVTAIIGFPVEIEWMHHGIEITAPEDGTSEDTVHDRIARITDGEYGADLQRYMSNYNYYQTVYEHEPG